MKPRSLVPIAFAVLAAAALAGCSKSADKPVSTLTEHQRDSVLAREPIPGAPAVGRAMQAADKEAAHSASVDSMAH